MKKMLVCVVGALLMCSCYNSSVCVGTMKKNDPRVEINSVWNHHFLYGLIPGGKTKLEAKDYVGDHSNYMIKTNWNFVNGFLNVITFGIYTPTTTTFYVPIEELKSK